MSGATKVHSELLARHPQVQVQVTSSFRKERLPYATTSCGQFVLLAVYLPGSQPVSATFKGEISSVFEWLATVYSCPVVIFSVHVDDRATASLNSCEKQPLVSDSSVCVALCWRGSGRICLAERSVSIDRPSSTLFAHTRKGQCWVRRCSLCTQRTLQLWRRCIFINAFADNT